ncbi:hypothetical protein G6F22_018415 [Rhizopus arrhizus]|nr:hypothetical protein G6F22_018415 [Rhizopus arrhizus]
MALDQARHDVHRGRVAAFDFRQQRSDAFQVDGHIQISRFFPALRAAHHAASDHRQRGFGAHPVAAGLLERQVETGQRGAGGAVLQGLRQAHDAPGKMARVQGVAPGVQAVGAQR